MVSLNFDLSGKIVNTVGSRPTVQHGRPRNIPPRCYDPAYRIASFFAAIAKIAILIFRQTGEIVHANEEAERLYGYSQQELQLQQRKVTVLVLVPANAEKLLLTSRDLTRRLENPPPPYRRLNLHRDGTRVAVTVVLGTVAVADEIFIIKYIIDASSVEQTENELEEYPHRFKAVADYTYDWETWLDHDGSLIWVNPAVERVAGFSVTQCKAMSDYPLPIVLDEDRAKVGTLVANALLGSSGNDVEFRIRNKRGFFK
jgi:PAS domain S-box-containing protein